MSSFWDWKYYALSDVSVDLGRQLLCLAEEGISVWSPGVGPHPSSSQDDPIWHTVSQACW